MVPSLAIQCAMEAVLRPLSDETVKELLSFALKEREINFTTEHLQKISEHLDGHPFNVKFAVKYIETYGIDSLLRDPSELIEWKRRRAADFLERLIFDKDQIDILAALSEYRYLAIDMLISILRTEVVQTAKHLRTLEDFCCVERRGSYFFISAPIREAVRRDRRFDKSDAWKQSVAKSICDLIQDYKDEDTVRVSILESATLAAARGGTAPAFISNLILPSHLLRIARDFYDQGKRRDCIEFCTRAYEVKKRLPIDAQIEVLRLWGLSAVRLNDNGTYQSVLNELAGYTGSVASRVSYFLKGFHHRLRENLDGAEEMHLKAWTLSHNNLHINRELASIYCKQNRYTDAESHARAAYNLSPTNPFLIDILAETLLEKNSNGFTC